MTSVEDKVRAALRGKAEQVPPGVVPPLRLPARRRRPFSLAYGGGGRNRAPAWRGWLAAAACAAVVAAVAAGSVTVSHVLSGRQTASGHETGVAAMSPSARAAWREAAAWVATQVSRSTIVACDPAMCRALRADGFPGGELLVLGPGAPYPLNAAVVIATLTVRSQFSSSLGAAYAPAVLASFGSGNTRIDVRVISSQGAAAYRAALSADVLARKTAAVSLLHFKRIGISGTPAKELADGQADTRLLITIVRMATLQPVTIVDFGRAAPGASPGIPLRSVDLAKTSGVALTRTSAYVRSVLALLSALSPPFRPARVGLVRLAGGQTVLRVEFAAPSPLGLLNPAG